MADVETPPVGEEPPAADVVEAPINAEPDVADIAAQAKNPDAVSNAIKAERDKAKAEREARLAAEARVKEFEDAQKSEDEKREEALEAARKESELLKQEVKKLTVSQLRTEVASEKSLPPRLAARLTGETREEIEADAVSLLEDLGTLPVETPPPGDGGARTPVTPKDLNEQIREAEAAGDYRKAMDLKAHKLVSKS